MIPHKQISKQKIKMRDVRRSKTFQDFNFL